MIRGPQKVAGRLTVPGDKSVTHRALIYSALAVGSTEITNMLASADCLSTLDCLRRLGVDIEFGPGPRAVVHGRGLFGLREPADVLDVGNSGTALRVLPGAVAGQDFVSFFTGDESIRGRPVDRIIEPLTLMGADIRARGHNRLSPFAVFGRGLSGVEYVLPVASAQVKTAVLTAGLIADGETTVVEPIPSRDHTELMLAFLGADIAVENDGLAGGARRVTVCQRPFAAKDIEVPADFSSAAFFLAAGILAGESTVSVERMGLNKTRTGLLEVMEEMGASVRIEEDRSGAGEPTGTVIAGRSALRSTTVGGALIPRLIDELPLLVLLATQAEGVTHIKDAAELRVKETDRIALTAAELNKMGAKVVPTADGFRVRGPTPLRGAAVQSHGDHRLAMMLAIAALVAEGETVIEGADAVDVSFPDFFARLEKVFV